MRYRSNNELLFTLSPFSLAKIIKSTPLSLLMLKFLSKVSQLFKPIEEPLIELDLSTFPAWLEREVAQSNFPKYVPEYFQQLSELKRELLDKAELLQEKDIPEEHQKGTTPRVKTIVLGNKQHYVQAVENFAEKISPPANTPPKSIIELQQAHQFNQYLNQRLGDFSRLSEKSYHAAKHLFYEEVDEIAKVFKTINDLLLEFERKAQDLTIMNEIEHNFSKLVQETRLKESLLQEIKKQQTLIKELTSQHQETRENESKILNCAEYKHWLKLKEREEELAVQIKQLDDQVYSYLSKLSKPLRKFQYGAKDKLIDTYLTNGVQAFWNDEEMKILSILDALKESLQLKRISFEEKLQKNYLEQLQAKEELQELKTRGKELQQQNEKILQELSNNPTAAELEQTQTKQKQIEQDISKQEAQLSEMQHQLEKISLIPVQENISKLAKKIFNKSITLTL